MTLFDVPCPVPLLPHKSVTVDFSGGDLSSDAGLIPLALADQRLELTEKLAQAIDDPRDPRRIDHTMHDLLRERIYLIAQGYADANDANSLRHDPLLKLALGRAPSEPALAGQSTLCRLENAVTPADREAMAKVLLEQFLARCGKDHAPWRADKKLGAGFDLKLPDLHADRRLRYVHANSASREGTGFGNRYECF
jgi:hypothetical protein